MDGISVVKQASRAVAVFGEAVYTYCSGNCMRPHTRKEHLINEPIFRNNTVSVGIREPATFRGAAVAGESDLRCVRPGYAHDSLQGRKGRAITLQHRSGCLECLVGRAIDDNTLKVARSMLQGYGAAFTTLKGIVG